MFLKGSGIHANENNPGHGILVRIRTMANMRVRYTRHSPLTRRKISYNKKVVPYGWAFSVIRLLKIN